MIIILMKTGSDGRMHYFTIHDRQQLLDAPYAYSAAYRVGLGRERERIHAFDSISKRDRSLRSLVAKRIKEGYRLLYSFSRAGFGAEAEGLLSQAPFESASASTGEAAFVRDAASGKDSRSGSITPRSIASGERHLPRPDGEY